MKIGIILQGVPSDLDLLRSHLEHIQKYISSNDIMISSWVDYEIKDEYVQKSSNQLYSSIIDKQVQSFDLINRNNRVKQLYTTYMGIEELVGLKKNAYKYDFIIKSRVDGFVEDYGPLIETMIANPTKIVSSSLFFRKDYPYHFGDIVYGGTLQNMVDLSYDALKYLLKLNTVDKYCKEIMHNNMWQEAMSYDNRDYISRDIRWDLNTLPPETVIGILYLYHKTKYTVRLRDMRKLMMDYFLPFDANKFGKYYFTCNNLKCTINSNWSRKELVKSLCTQCHKYLLCNHKKHVALLIKLFDSQTTDVEEYLNYDNVIQDYFDIDGAITESYYVRDLMRYYHEALRAPWKHIEELKYQVEL